MRYFIFSFLLLSPASAFAGPLECQGTVLANAIAAYQHDVADGLVIKDISGVPTMRLDLNNVVTDTEVHDIHKKSYQVVFRMFGRTGGSVRTTISGVNADCTTEDPAEYSHLTYTYFYPTEEK